MVYVCHICARLFETRQGMKEHEAIPLTALALPTGSVYAVNQEPLELLCREKREGVSFQVAVVVGTLTPNYAHLRRPAFMVWTLNPLYLNAHPVEEAHGFFRPNIRSESVNWGKDLRELDEYETGVVLDVLGNNRFCVMEKLRRTSGVPDLDIKIGQLSPPSIELNYG